MNSLRFSLIAVLLMSFTNASHAFFIKDSLDYFKRGMQLCKEGFTKRVRGSHVGKDRVRRLIRRLDRALEDKEEWLHQKTPTLLKDLYEFKVKAEALLTQGVSVSDSLNIQKELEGLVLPFAFWGITENMEILGKAFFVSLKNSEKDFTESFQEWGEAKLGRELNEKEVKALEDSYNYSVINKWDMKYLQLSWDLMVAERYFMKQNFLKEAGFSEEEIEKLGWKKVLRGGGGGGNP